MAVLLYDHTLRISRSRIQRSFYNFWWTRVSEDRRRFSRPRYFENRRIPGKIVHKKDLFNFRSEVKLTIKTKRSISWNDLLKLTNRIVDLQSKRPSKIVGKIVTFQDPDSHELWVLIVVTNYDLNTQTNDRALRTGNWNLFPRYKLQVHNFRLRHINDLNDKLRRQKIKLWRVMTDYQSLKIMIFKGNRPSSWSEFHGHCGHPRLYKIYIWLQNDLQSFNFNRI